MMKTRAEAEAKLSELTLTKPVTVEDTVSPLGEPCRAFRFAGGAVFTSRDPDDAELDTLARNLPVPDEKRAETIEALKPTKAAALKRD